MTNGQRFITAYFILAYFAPLVGNVLFSEGLESSYTIYPLTARAVVALFVVYGVSLTLSSRRIRMLPPLAMPAPAALVGWIGRVYRRCRLPLALVALVLAIASVWLGLNSYRYEEKSISDTGSGFLMFVMVLNTVISMDLFYAIFVSSDHAMRGVTRTRIETVLLSLVLVLLANGSGSMFLALVALSFSLMPRLVRAFLFALRLGRRRLRALGRAAGSAAAIVCIVCGALFAGETIKALSSGDYSSPFEAARSVASGAVPDDQIVKDPVHYLIERLSIYYYSYLFTEQAPRAVLNNGAISPVIFPLRNLVFRLNYVVGAPFSVERPMVNSLMTLNYRLLTIDDPVRDNLGSSPGLMASFDYVFMFPFNIIFCSLYVVMIARLIDGYARRQRVPRLSLIGVLLLLLFLQNLFQSPFDFLNVIDENSISAILLAGLALADGGTARSLALGRGRPGSGRMPPLAGGLRTAPSTAGST